MLGGVLEIIGLIALLVGACELVARWLADRATAREMQRQHDVLSGYPPPPDAPCAFPRLEPELERLRDRGAL
jgi:hypothetical protein